MTASLTIIRPKEFIVIAADSCQSDGFGKQTGSACKIVSLGNFVYVANSFIYHDQPRFDLAATFKRIETVKSLSELVATIRKVVSEPLTGALAYGRTCDKTGFIETFKARRPLGITIAGIEKGKLASVNLDFQIEDLTASKLRLAIVERWCPGPACPENIATNAVAEPGYRARFPKEYPGSGWAALKPLCNQPSVLCKMRSMKKYRASHRLSPFWSSQPVVLIGVSAGCVRMAKALNRGLRGTLYGPSWPIGCTMSPVLEVLGLPVRFRALPQNLSLLERTNR